MSEWASRLKERVEIRQPVLTGDELGGDSVSWTNFATVWAEVEAMTGTREQVVGAQLQANAGYRVRMRARTDVNATMRLIWKTHTLLIHSLHERGEVLDILAYEEGL